MALSLSEADTAGLGETEKVCVRVRVRVMSLSESDTAGLGETEKVLIR
jgi:hypothetical protein